MKVRALEAVCVITAGLVVASLLSLSSVGCTPVPNNKVIDLLIDARFTAQYVNLPNYGATYLITDTKTGKEYLANGRDWAIKLEGN